jgi:AcrR family transcriptional regulator
MGIQERREREREEMRQLIMNAARDLFVAEGYEAVTMRKIAEKIEYSATAIYFHFKDKESLMHALCESDFAAFGAEFAKLLKIKDPIDRLRRAGQAYIDFGLQNPQHYRLMFMTPRPPTHSTDVSLEKGNPEEDAYAFLLLLIQEAFAAGRLRSDLKDPHLVAQVVWAGVHGIVSLHIAKCEADWVDWRPVARQAKAMVDVLVRGITE